MGASQELQLGVSCGTTLLALVSLISPYVLPRNHPIPPNISELGRQRAPQSPNCLWVLVPKCPAGCRQTRGKFSQNRKSGRKKYLTESGAELVPWTNLSRFGESHSNDFLTIIGVLSLLCPVRVLDGTLEMDWKAQFYYS